MVTVNYKILTAHTADGLNRLVKEFREFNQGWEPVGSHTVITKYAQNRYSGMQHMSTDFTVEYAQSMRREE